MSPVGPVHPEKPSAPSNIYTVLVAFALGVVLATTVFVAFTCYDRYGTLFKLP